MAKGYQHQGTVARPRSGAFIVRNSQRYMFSSNGFRANTQRYQPGGSALSGVGERWYVSDDYWTFAPRFLFANWYLTTGSDGGQEAANGNAVVIDDAAIVVSGVATRIQFSGATGKTLTDDTEVWSDPAEAIILPPRTRFCIRTAWTVADANAYLSAPSQGLSPMFGDKGEISTTTLAAKVMAGGISTTAPTGNNIYGYGPCAMVAKGWDGRPVALVIGTSIEQGVGQSRLRVSSMREQGPAGRGMASTYGNASRYPAAVFAVSGGFAAGIKDATSTGGISRRARAFAALPNLPFSVIFSGFGTNDQTATLATWKTAMTTMLTTVRSVWPNIRIVQSTLWSRVTSTDAYTTVANQTVATNWAYPAGSYWGLRSWMLDLCDGLVDAVIDIQDTLDNVSGGGVRAKWRVDVLDGWATTLSALRSGGETSMTVGAQPRPGSCIAINDGTHEAALISTLPSTAAPFTVNLLSALAGAHSAAAAVKEAVTIDGVHPGDLIAGYIADRCFAAHKIAGTFG